VFGYSARDAARLLGLPVTEVRALARSGLVTARRERGALRFGFQDLVLLRAAAGLARARLPRARVRRALARLRAQLPAGRALASVTVGAEGDEIVVRDGAARWAPETGQTLLDFGVAEIAAEVAPLIREAARRRPGALDADGFYLWGCDLEDGAPAEARQAYRRALLLDPDHAGAALNLGRLLHEARDLVAAEELYRRAAGSEEHGATATFNLGVVLEDQGRLDEALLAYARVLRARPQHADAHYNASRLLERLGRREEALRHLSAYRRLTRGA
jgi:tetratricopeptide (TPR) repeat protein